MILRRPRLAEAAKRYILEYESYDPFELGLYLRRRLVEYMANRGPESIDEVMGELAEVARMFSYNSVISMVAALAERLAHSGYLEDLDKRGYSRLLGEILETVERVDLEGLSLAAGALSSELLPGTEVYAAAAGGVVERVLVTARARLGYVRVPVSEPLKHGLSMSERLLRMGIKSTAVPDDMEYWAVERSHAVIIPLYAASRDGLVVTDYGVKPAVKLAWRLGRRVYVLYPWSSLLRAFEEPPVEPGRPPLRPYDVLDPEGGDTLLVTDKLVVRLDKRTLTGGAEEAGRRLSDIVRLAYMRVAEAGLDG